MYDPFMVRTAGHAFLLVTMCLVPGGCKTDECSSQADCDDGLFCNGFERCVNGSCVGGQIPGCDDGIDSTVDGCDEEADACVHTCVDMDGDGHLSSDCAGGDDCDDEDAGVHPGAEEACNLEDDDCDGIVAEDVDRDGHMSAAMCASAGGDDCDDEDAGVHPGAPEICDGRDDDCDGSTDDEADTDGDGHVEVDCASSPGGDDCDDEDAGVHPGAPETCNGVDDDCTDGCDDAFACCAGVDEVACVTTCATQGTGICTDTCEPPDGLVSCEPPEEVCNGEDDDCDGARDNGFECAALRTTQCTTTCGTTGEGTCSETCEPPLATGCHPPAETCNGEDDDCDGACDEGFDCCAGEDVTCVTTCGSTNVLPCTEACTVLSPAACTLVAELDCTDGEDDDCDGYIDDYGDTDCM